MAQPHTVGPSPGGWIDRIAASLATWGLPPLFRNGVESPPLTTHLEDTTIDLPSLDDDEYHAIQAATATGPVAAGVRTATELSPERPTIIFLHGFGELPFDTTFDRLLRPHASPFEANLVAVQAPYHQTPSSLAAGTASLERMLRMQAVATLLIEALRRRCHNQLGTEVVVAGTSLGGFITNLHHVHFTSADRYVPMLAGLAQDDVFLHAAYRQGVAASALRQADTIERHLNFETAFKQSPPQHVHPLLAREDRIVRFERQMASYGGRPINTIAGGHLGAATAIGALRDHLHRVLKRLDAKPLV